MLRKIALFSISSLCVLSAVKAQRHYPHSLSVGLVNNLAQLDDHRMTTGLALNLNHQRNIGEFFALRTGLMSSYFLPVTRSWQFIEPDGSDGGRLDYNRSYMHFGLNFTPLAYYRHKKFSFFAGLGGGLGLQLEKRKTYYDGQTAPGESSPAETYFQLGWKPVIGFGYKFGPGDSVQELEITFSRQEWWIPGDGPYSSPFIWYGLEIAYRHNFKKG